MLNENQKKVLEKYWSPELEKSFQRRMKEDPMVREFFEKHPEMIEHYKFRVVDVDGG